MIGSLQMEVPRVELVLVAAPDDPPFRSPQYQRGLHRFADSLKAEGVSFGLGIELIEAAGGEAPAIYTGVFTLAVVLSGPVSRCIVAWLKGRAGRKARVEINSDGGLKAEAHSTDEVERLITKAAEYQQIMSEIIAGEQEEKQLPKATEPTALQKPRDITKKPTSKKFLKTPKKTARKRPPK
jgi:hypothetical protein